MSPKKPANEHAHERILSRVRAAEFVGRTDALRRLIERAETDDTRGGLLLLLAPSAGVSELLRQAYDQLFHRHTQTVPIYFALTRNERKPERTARHFLYTFLQQLAAFRLREPRYASAALTRADLLDLAAPADYEWIERLIAAIEHEDVQTDVQAFVRLCLSVPERAAARGVKSFVMIDAAQLAEPAGDELSLGAEFVQALTRSRLPFALAGLRRQVLDLVHDTLGDFDDLERFHLPRLDDADAGRLAEYVAEREQVELSPETRDLIIQQLDGSPLFITSLVQAARERALPLTSFRHSQQLYIDELMGGRTGRHFSSVLEEIAPAVATRRALVRLLYETAASDSRKSVTEAWRRRLEVGAEEAERILHGLHVHELANVNSSLVEMTEATLVWRDYLHARYRLEIAAEPRAFVVASMLTESLKRAPQTMARRYRRQTAIGLRHVLERFDCQRVPASLLHYDRFSRLYKGVDPEEVTAALDSETDLVRLPQIVSVASSASFHPPAQMQLEEERSAIAHGFDAGSYAEANEVVWIATEIDSKLEAGRGLAEIWYDRLTQFARARAFEKVRLWMITPEGFTPEAAEFLRERGAYSSSRRQWEFLAARLGETHAGEVESDEFELTIPMGEERELIAAHTVEQIARRINFKPEAINQIKTAVIEACINASEHSLSPDRKIYQRVRVENDRLVVTVSSRGVVPAEINNGEGDLRERPLGNGGSYAKERRGWGLGLIRTLMDEVEFERVDDGTRLRMTKYVRKP